MKMNEKCVNGQMKFIAVHCSLKVPPRVLLLASASERSEAIFIFRRLVKSSTFFWASPTITTVAAACMNVGVSRFFIIQI